MRTVALVVVVLLTSGCKKPTPASEDGGVASVDAAGPSAAAESRLSDSDGRALVKGACLSCHSEEMVAQQRLTPAQWTKTVTKMVGWGANLEPKDAAPLAAWLATTYGLDAGSYEPAVLDAHAAPAEIAPTDDGVFARGDVARGHALYTDRCSGCHGPEAQGHIGVRLADRPGLYRAADFAQTLRRGRGKMPPQPLTDGEVADVLAHLRELR